MRSQQARAFAGQDLHLSGQTLISHQPATGEHILLLPDGCSMTVGANHFQADKAVVLLQSLITEYHGRSRVDYDTKVYLQGNVSVEKGPAGRTTGLNLSRIDNEEAMVLWFSLRGEVFVTAGQRKSADPSELKLYKDACRALRRIRTAPPFVVQPEAKVPLRRVEKEPRAAVVEPNELKPAPQQKEPHFRYPVNIAPAGETAPDIQWDQQAQIATIVGRFYLWQKLDEKGGLLELQADNAVVFYSGQAPQTNRQNGQIAGSPAVLSGTQVQAVYMSGDIVMSEGRRTITADELYYDFEQRKTIAINAAMRSFDVSRQIPIYVRAAKLRQLARNSFSGEDVAVTSSEFYKPQISMTASKVMVTDTTTVDQQLGRLSDSSYDAQMHDVRLKAGDRTIFYWPFVRSNLQRPDTPIKSVRAGYDSDWGPSLETRWYLSRLLGLRQPEGTDSTFALDFYGKRGLGSGVEIDYRRQDYFGRMLGYVIHDTGEDDLGRHRSRENLEPPRKLRGRFSWRHRQFLPYNWQLTTGIGYASDENFIEGYYRSEYNVGVREETYVHLKRIQDNWGLSILAKGRINDFSDELEELPSAEFHLTGKSLFEDRFTLYSDTGLGRLRQRIGNKHSTLIDEQMFSFASHRTELDMPLWADPFKLVPFVAGTFGYDDRSGFQRTLVDGSYSGDFGEDNIWLGEAGIRLAARPYWKRYPEVKSRIWDVNGLRHIIKPQLTAVLYDESDDVVRQHNVVNFSLSQRLQTKRGPVDKQRSVDWIRLDTDLTWVNHSQDQDETGPGPDRFIWNRSMVPLRVLSAPEIFNGSLLGKLHRFETYGPRRNYWSTDLTMRLTDTTAVLSDLYYDLHSGTVEQYNLGLVRMRWPNLSYYIGTRYLRRIQVLKENGSNALTFAATYRLDPRYTLMYSAQFDFDYGENVRNDIALIRRYHRLYYSFTYSADESLDRQAIVFSIWPQGVPELAIGQGRYIGLGGSAGF